MIIKDIQKYIELYDTERYLFYVIGPKVRKRGYLIFDEFYKICMWKSTRQKNNYLKNKNIVEKTTKKAFSEKEESNKIEILCSNLNGVSIKTASAVLTVVYPKEYGIIDERCLDMLNRYGIKISKYNSVGNWLKYLEIIRKLAKDNKRTPRDIDMALFAMHREMQEKTKENLYKKHAIKRK